MRNMTAIRQREENPIKKMGEKEEKGSVISDYQIVVTG